MECFATTYFGVVYLTVIKCQWLPQNCPGLCGYAENAFLIWVINDNHI